MFWLYDIDKIVRDLNNTWSVFNPRVHQFMVKQRDLYKEEMGLYVFHDKGFNQGLRRGSRRVIYRDYERKLKVLGEYAFEFLKGTDLVVFFNKGVVRLDIESLVLMRAWCGGFSVRNGIRYHESIIGFLDYLSMVSIYYRLDLMIKIMETSLQKNGLFKPYLELYQQLDGGVVYAGDLGPIQRLKVYPYMVMPELGTSVIWSRRGLISYIFEHVVTHVDIARIMELQKEEVNGNFVTFVDKGLESDILEYLLNGQSVALIPEIFGEDLYRRGQGRWGNEDGTSLIWNHSEFYSKGVRKVLFLFQELYINTVFRVAASVGGGVVLNPKLTGVSDRSVVHYYENTLVLNDNKGIISSISNDVEMLNDENVIMRLDEIFTDLDGVLNFLL